MRGPLLAAVAAALLLAGCGDDSDDGSVAESTTTSVAESAADEGQTSASEADTGETKSAESETATADESAGDTLTKEEYEARFQKISDEARAAAAELQDTVTGTDPSDFDALAEAFRASAEYTGDISAQLDELQPPADIASEHQGYVDVLLEAADGYVEVADGIAGAGDQAGVTAELQQLQEIFTNERNSAAMLAFAKAVKRGDYDLGLEVDPGQALPGAPTP